MVEAVKWLEALDLGLGAVFSDGRVVSLRMRFERAKRIILLSVVCIPETARCSLANIESHTCHCVRHDIIPLLVELRSVH